MRLTLSHVGLSFDGAPGEGTRALEDVSLEVSGGVVGLMGQTGSGKTTLLEVMAGMLRPDEGSVLVDGRVACGAEGSRALAGAVGLVFQIPERQFFEPTVERELTFGLRSRGLGAAEARERAGRALALMGLDLDELGSRSPLALSGGQQRRVAIASVLALEPSLLLLDEPTAGLDPRSRSACVDAVRAAARSGATHVVIDVAQEDGNGVSPHDLRRLIATARFALPLAHIAVRGTCDRALLRCGADDADRGGASVKI